MQFLDTIMSNWGKVGEIILQNGWYF